jgi:hypothetical protein
MKTPFIIASQFRRHSQDDRFTVAGGQFAPESNVGSQVRDASCKFRFMQQQREWSGDAATALGDRIVRGVSVGSQLLSVVDEGHSRHSSLLHCGRRRQARFVCGNGSWQRVSIR